MRDFSNDFSDDFGPAASEPCNPTVTVTVAGLCADKVATVTVTITDAP
jgi:hypothetical protein